MPVHTMPKPKVKVKATTVDSGVTAGSLLAGIDTTGALKKKKKSKTASKGPALVTTMPPVKDASTLMEKTVFLKCRFGILGNSKKITGSEVLQTDADASLLKVQKTLLDSAELDAIRKADGQMRTWLYNTCLPFDMGIMLLPVGLIEEAEKKLQTYKTEREELILAFMEAYPKLCASASEHLGSLYDPSDYPVAEALKDKFNFTWQYVSFSVPGQLKSISTELFKKEQQKAADTLQEATLEITALMRQTMFELVQHLQDRLTPGNDGKPLVLRESAVKKLQEFLNTFDLRNVTDDGDLAEQVTKMRALISGTSAKALRNSDLFRDKILNGMKGITAQLSTLVQEAPGRRFRED